MELSLSFSPPGPPRRFPALPVAFRPSLPVRGVPRPSSHVRRSRPARPVLPVRFACPFETPRPSLPRPPLPSAALLLKTVVFTAPLSEIRPPTLLN